MKKRILFLSPLHSRSGSSVRIKSIARVFCDLGYRVTLSERRIGEDHFEYKDVRYTGPRESRLLVISIIRSLFFNLRLVFREEYDIVFCLKPLINSAWPAVMASPQTIRILDIDDMDYAYYSNALARIAVYILTKWFLVFFKRITYHHPDIPRHLKLKNAYQLQQGVGLQPILTGARESMRLKMNIPPNAKVLLYAGSLDMTSGFGELIEPLGRYVRERSSVILLIIGHGRRRAQYQKQFTDKGLLDNTRFLGYINHEEIPGYLSCADVGVNYLPPGGASRFRASLKVREYLQAGLKVVTNLEGDSRLFREYVEIFETPDTLINALDACDTREKPGGKEFVAERFSWDRIVGDFEKTL